MDLITEFWQWLGMSKEKYIFKMENPQNSSIDFEEYMFPKWSALLDEARENIREERLEPESLEKVLTVMALDNETEDVLDFIVENASDNYIEKFVQYGVLSILYHARWQIAEILGRRQPRNWENLIDELVKDENAYVSKRAANIRNNKAE